MVDLIDPFLHKHIRKTTHKYTLTNTSIVLCLMFIDQLYACTQYLPSYSYIFTQYLLGMLSLFRQTLLQSKQQWLENILLEQVEWWCQFRLSTRYISEIVCGLDQKQIGEQVVFL